MYHHSRQREGFEMITKLAERLRAAYGAEPVPPLRDELPAGDVDLAYQVQEVNTQHWLAAGRRLVGRKIGLTSAAVQRQLGVDEPDFGMLFADMSVDSGGEVPAGSLLQPRVEAEIAFVLGRDLDAAEHRRLGRRHRGHRGRQRLLRAVRAGHHP